MIRSVQTALAKAECKSAAAAKSIRPPAVGDAATRRRGDRIDQSIWYHLSHSPCRRVAASPYRCCFCLHRRCRNRRGQV